MLYFKFSKCWFFINKNIQLHAKVKTNRKCNIISTKDTNKLKNYANNNNFIKKKINKKKINLYKIYG